MQPSKPILAVAISALMGATAWAAGTQGQQYRANLSGARQVPPVTAVDTRAKANFRFNSDRSQLKFSLNLRQGADITEAHLHCAPPGSNRQGPIVASLFGLAGPAAAPLLPYIPGGFNGDLSMAGTLTDADLVRYPDPGSGDGDPMPQGCSAVLGAGRDIVSLAQLADAIGRGEIYVNVHSVQHPEGVVRGTVTVKGGNSGTRKGPGGGGTTSGTGGGTAGTGGYTSGAGGSTSGAGGSTSGTGGSTSGAGGSTSGAGGSTSGAGGSTLGTGGYTSGTGGSNM